MNHKKFSVSLRRLAVATAFGGLSLVPVVAQACAVEPYIGSVCIMAWPRTANFGNSTFMAAVGQTLSIQQYQALFAVIGVTYGGNAQTDFKLPDLRGRAVIGAGTLGVTNFNYGAAGGAQAVSLTQANLPPHIHPVKTVAAGTNPGVVVAATSGNMAVATTLTGLSATTSLNGVTGTVSGSGFTLRGTNTGTAQVAAQGSALGGTTGTSRVYSDGAPNVDMKAGSISGSANVAFTGNPTTTITGSPTSTLSGNPSVIISGTTESVGGGAAVSLMQPYLPMTYYIAVNGIYPSLD